jgi:hypothetical protein
MSTSVFILPLTNVPQTFAITLADIDYILTCKWNNAPDAGWVMDFTNALTNEFIATNIPLITGADCLAGLEYLGFQGQLAVYTNGDQNAVPTLDNLGVECNVYFLTDISS